MASATTDIESKEWNERWRSVVDVAPGIGGEGRAGSTEGRKGPASRARKLGNTKMTKKG